MSFIGSMFDDKKGAGFQGQQVANPAAPVEQAALITPANQAQADQQYNNAQSAIEAQRNFVGALQGQNGIGNQSSVFNQLQGVANGQGPNPAQAMLAQATGANTANQASLMAGQRGAGANPALLARMAAQQGAANQQAAAGQGATMQANQSLNALGQLGGIAGQQVAQQAGALGTLNQAAQSEQQNVLNSLQGSNTARVNNAQIGAEQANNMRNNQYAQQSNLNQVGAGIAQQNLKSQSDMVGGILSAAGAAATGAAHGGVMSNRGHYANGGPVDDQMSLPVAQMPVATNPMPVAAPISDPYHVNTYLGQHPLYGSAPSNQANANQEPDPLKDKAGSALSAFGAAMKPEGNSSLYNGFKNFGTAMFDLIKGEEDELPKSEDLTVDEPKQQDVQGGHQLEMMAKGGKVKALLSPGEKYLTPEKAKKVAQGRADVNKAGIRVPGKAKVKGDSEVNDTVPADLEEGGVVIPRSVMQSKDPAKEAAKFVAAHLSRYNLRKGK